jgi:hypothetical protein
MDWIQARFECSLEHALLVLRERVNADIGEWRKRMGDAEPDSAIQVTDDGRRTVISRPEPVAGSGPWVVFEAKESCIAIRRGAHESVAPSRVEETRLIPAVNSEGQCRLRHGAEELEFWQASRLILEDLLFR